MIYFEWLCFPIHGGDGSVWNFFLIYVFKSYWDIKKKKNHTDWPPAWVHHTTVSETTCVNTQGIQGSLRSELYNRSRLGFCLDHFFVYVRKGFTYKQPVPGTLKALQSGGYPHSCQALCEPIQDPSGFGAADIRQHPQRSGAPPPSQLYFKDTSLNTCV